MSNPKTSSDSAPGQQNEPACSFCRKGRDKVRTLIAGPEVYICDKCVDLCGDILDKEYELPIVDDGSGSQPAMFNVAAACALCRLPTPIGELLAIPDRGFLCVVCLEAVRVAAEQSR